MVQAEDELRTALVTDTEAGHEDWFLVPDTLPGSNPTPHCCLPISHSKAALEGMLWG